MDQAEVTVVNGGASQAGERWGDYSAATPDPRPIIAGRGVVWGTNQYSGLVNPPAGGVNWRTQIFATEP